MLLVGSVDADNETQPNQNQLQNYSVAAADLSHWYIFLTCITVYSSRKHVGVSTDLMQAFVQSPAAAAYHAHYLTPDITAPMQ